MNTQLAIKDEKVYVLEVNPRASRTIPFVAKARGIPIAKIAAKIMTGDLLQNILTDNDNKKLETSVLFSISVSIPNILGEEELYFYLENSSMLEAVATYYSLPEPCTSDTKSKIDSNPEDFRLRHQDINQIGSRSVPVVIASIVFKDNVATMFKLYEITRWNE